MNNRVHGSAARWVVGYTAAVTGDVMYSVVLSWTATKAGGPLLAGLVLAVGSVPRALLMLPGGVFADRVSPRRVVIGTDTVRLVFMVVAALLGWLIGVLPVWLVAIAFVFGVVDAFFLPAVGAMPPHLVARERLTRLQAWRIAGLRISNTVGPLAGGAVIILGVSASFVSIAALFALSVALLLTVKLRRPDAAPEPSRTKHPIGTRAVWAQLRVHGLVPLLLATALSELPFSGPVSIGIVLLVQLRHWPVETVGFLLAAFSITSFAVTLLCAVLPARFLAKPTVLISLLATAVLLPALALAPTAWLAMAVTGALGASTSITMVVCQGQVQRATPPELLGRATSILTLFTLGLGPILYAVTGIVVAALGFEVFFIFMALFVLAAAVAWAMTRKVILLDATKVNA